MKANVNVFLAFFVSTSFSADVLSLPQNRTSLNLTVYNNNRALIQENRKIKLDKGISTIRFEGVSATIIPQSLIVVSKDGFDVLEQNYEFDLISREKLLDKYISKEITLIDENKILGDKKNVSAKLIANNFIPVFEVDGKILLGFDGKILLPQIPENLYAKPTMNWLVQSQKSGESNANVSYLASGISWNADYVMLLSDNDKSASITAWVTLTNQAGTSFENAKLSLVAGDVNLTNERNQPAPANGVMFARSMQAEMAVPKIDEKSFDEYHIYSVNNNVTINDNQTKQIEMFSANDIKVKKRYRVQSAARYYARDESEKGTKLDVRTEIVFETGKKNNLDMPFPKGVIRIYKKDGKNNVFLGEDNINHTPINEEIALKSGNAFDITCFEKKVSEKRIGEQKMEFVKEIIFANHKKESVSVMFDETNLRGKWTIKSDSKYVKLNANTARFELNIASGKEVVLTYTATVGE